MLADSAPIIAVINTLYYVPLQQVNYVVKACGASVLISHYNTQQQKSSVFPLICEEGEWNWAAKLGVCTQVMRPGEAQGTTRGPGMVL